MVVGVVSVGMGLAIVALIALPVALISYLSGLEFASDNALTLLGVVSGIAWIGWTIATAPQMFRHFNNKKGTEND